METTFTIEIQYRGLPHIHLIIWTDETPMDITNNEVDDNEDYLPDAIIYDESLMTHRH